MLLQQDNRPGVVQPGDTPVNIGANEQVLIRVADSHGSLAVRMAPYALIVHTFKGAQLTDAIMGSARTRPINIPEFDEQRGDLPYMDYADGDNPQWGTIPPSYGTWEGSPMIAQGLVASNATIYGPYVQFEGSGNVTGRMDYGLVFGVTSDGQNIGYFWFDPNLNINSR
jgi:hypothetical protein